MVLQPRFFSLAGLAAHGGPLVVQQRGTTALRAYDRCRANHLKTGIIRSYFVRMPRESSRLGASNDPGELVRQ